MFKIKSKKGVVLAISSLLLVWVLLVVLSLVTYTINFSNKIYYENESNVRRYMVDEIGQVFLSENDTFFDYCIENLNYSVDSENSSRYVGDNFVLYNRGTNKLDICNLNDVVYLSIEVVKIENVTITSWIYNNMVFWS